MHMRPEAWEHSDSQASAAKSQLPTHQWSIHLPLELLLKASARVGPQGSDHLPGGTPQGCPGSGPTKGVVGRGTGSAVVVMATGIAGLFRV